MSAAAPAASPIRLRHLGGECWVLCIGELAWFAEKNANENDGSFVAIEWAGIIDLFGDIQPAPEPNWQPFTYHPPH